jgi:hypothetical protein
MPIVGIAAAMMASPVPASAQETSQASEQFRFESIDSIEDMHRFVSGTFPVGSSRDAIRRTFVSEGQSTLIAHPSRDRVEKYVYDINLCGFYVWRWNVSADYDRQARVRQIYVNGEPVLAGGQSEPVFAPPPNGNPNGRILRMTRLRPEASRGESSLGYVMVDGDGDLATIEDQALVGGGPSRPHPADMGRMRGYQVSPWRSIFDSDPAARIVPYSGDCAAAEAAANATRQR